MAILNVKLCARSQKIHFNRTANKSIRIEQIQIKAVRESSNKIRVRGNVEI